MPEEDQKGRVGRRRKLLYLVPLFVLAILVAGAYVGARAYLPVLVENALGRPVAYESFHLNPFGRLELREVDLDGALHARLMDVRFSPAKLISRRTVRSVHIEDLRVDLDSLLLSEEAGTADTTEREIETEEGAGKRVFEVKRLTVHGASVRYGGTDLGLDTLESSATLRENGFGVRFKVQSLRVGAEGPIDLRGHVRKIGDEMFLDGFSMESPKVSCESGDCRYCGSEGTMTLTEVRALDCLTVGDLSLRLHTGEKRLHAEMQDLEISGIPLEEARVDLDFSLEDRFSVEELLILQPEGGVVRGEGNVVEPFGAEEDRAIDLSLDLSGVRGPLGSLRDLTVTGLLDVSGQGLEMDVRVELEELTFSGYPLRNILIRGTVSPDSARVHEVSVSDPKARFQGSGWLRGSEFELVYDAELHDPGKLPALGLGDVQGDLVLSGTVRKARETLILESRGIASGLKAGEFSVDTIKYVLSIPGEGARRIDLLSAGVRAGSFSLDTLRASVVTKGDTAGTYELSLDLDPETALGLIGEARVLPGGFEVSNRRILLERGALADTGVGLIAVEVTDAGRELRVRDLKFRRSSIDSFHLSLSGDGRTFSAGGEIRNLDLAPLPGILLIDEELSGVLSLHLQGQGSLDRPELSLRATVDSLVLGDIEARNVALELEAGEEELDLRRLNIVQETGETEIWAKLPATLSLSPFRFRFEPSGDVSARFTTSGLDCTLLNPLLGSMLFFGEGRITANVTIQGRTDMPEFTGSMRLTSEDAAYVPMSIPIQDLSADIELAGDRIVFQEFRASPMKGKVIGFGQISFDGPAVDSVDLFLDLEDVLYETGGNIVARASGTVDITGPADALYIEGEFDVSEAFVTYAFGGGNGTSGGPPAPSSERFTIRIRADKGIMFMNELANIELGADMEIKKTDDFTPMLSGQLDVLGGSFLYLDRNFDMLGEGITFQSTREINPSFNLNGQTVLNDTIVVYLTVGGTLTEPLITLRSEPPLPEEDIISLLSFGKLANEVPLAFGDLEELRDRTLNLASSLLSSQLRRKMRLTELKLKTGLTGGNPQVTVGLYVTRDLYFRYTHDLLAWDKDVFLMKYFLTRKTALYTERDKDGSLSTGVNFHFRF
jgi:hypothetical protein